jgi:hypothetical protein
MAGARRLKAMPPQASWAGAQLPGKASDVKGTPKLCFGFAFAAWGPGAAR